METENSETEWTMRPQNMTITCQNPKCLYFRDDIKKNIIKRGKNRAGHQQYLCHHCGKVFPETVNITLSDSSSR